DIIVDLMAGTHTVGYAMKQRCRMVANDIQRYSMVIGNTLLNYNPQPHFDGAVLEAFNKYYLANMRHLKNLFNLGFKSESTFVNAAKTEQPSWAEYSDFCENYPHFLRPTKAPGYPEEFMLLFGKHRVEAYRTLNKLEPYSLFSLYYANTYLGVLQCAQVDSIRYAIDKICDEWVDANADYGYDGFGLRCLLLSALIASISRGNPGPGHWAAFPRVNDRNYDYLLGYRRLDLHQIFVDRVKRIEEEIAKHQSPFEAHTVKTEDYVTFMAEVHEYIKKAKVVYLDPPYSQGHYSRFYHLIETLIQYDYPEISHSGRYRTDRHQSPFAHKGKVAAAVGAVCEVARDAGTTMVLSYSRGGIVPEHEAFQAILEKYYPTSKIELRTLSSEHSKLGQAKRMQTEEYIFTCRP
ncbi:DNA adenine methylase, partial [Calditrichota bacterium]